MCAMYMHFEHQYLSEYRIMNYIKIFFNIFTAVVVPAVEFFAIVSSFISNNKTHSITTFKRAVLLQIKETIFINLLYVRIISEFSK